MSGGGFMGAPEVRAHRAWRQEMMRACHRVAVATDALEDARDTAGETQARRRQETACAHLAWLVRETGG